MAKSLPELYVSVLTWFTQILNKNLLNIFIFVLFTLNTKVNGYKLEKIFSKKWNMVNKG